MSHDELESRLRAVETQLTELTTLVRAELAELRSLVKLHQTILLGNPGQPVEAPGVAIRLDRVEQREAVRAWGVRLAIASAFAALAAYVGQLL